MATLASYQTDVLRLVHDVSLNFFSLSQITDYVNQARFKTAVDSNCVRRLQSFTLTTPTEVYPFSAFPLGDRTINMWGINIINGGFRDPPRRCSWSFLSWQARSWVGYVQQPIFFAIYGENSVYLGPPPDQNYVCEFDTSVTPIDLISGNDVDVDIPPAWQKAVGYYAAYLAKEYQQMWQEANMFNEQYVMKLRQARAGTNPRVIGDVSTARR